MFVTIEPSHQFDWGHYDGWGHYNRTISQKFLEEWTGGPILEELLEPINGLDMNAAWMTDAIKCPPEGGIDDQARDEEFDHCRTYLRDEVERVDPSVIIGLGNNACKRTLSALGVERKTISTARECGRTYDTEPPAIISPHWSYGWLNREPSKSWGDDWRATHNHLEGSYSRNMDAVRASIRAVRKRSDYR